MGAGIHSRPRFFKNRDDNMFDNFMLCLNGIAPIFLLTLIGMFLKWVGIFDDNFAAKANNLVFKVSLPTMVFMDIATCDLEKQFDGKLVLIAVVSVVIMFAVSIGVSMIITRDNKKRAAFAQGVFRSNYAILGVPLTKALFEGPVAVNASVILAICVPIFNVLAVITLTAFLEKKSGILGVLKGVIKNPIIIGALLGAIVSLVKLPLPTLVVKTLDYLGDICVPLSLLVIGASLKMAKGSNMVMAIGASAMKCILTPLLFLFPAMLMGIDCARLGILFVYFAAPSAVSGYIMMRNMGGDYDMSGNIILISTAMSFFVIFIGMLIMKTAGMF